MPIASNVKKKSMGRVTKVLMIGADDAPGGVAGYINAIAANIQSARYEFHATVSAVQDVGFFVPSIKKHHFDIVYSMVDFLPKVVALRRLILNLRPDVVHLHTARAGLLGVIALAGLDIPIVYSGHSWRFEQKRFPIQKALFRRLEGFIAGNSDIVTFLTQREFSVGLSRGMVTSSQCVVVNTRIDATTPSRSSHVPDSSIKQTINGRRVVLNVGKLYELKNPLFFVDVAYCVSQIRAGVAFIWIGDGELRAEVERHASSLGISGDVLLLGQCSRDQVDAWLRHADLFLFTSIIEGVPLAVLEAKLAGLPIVSTDYAGVDAIVRHQVDGIVVSGNDALSCARQLVELLDDPVRRGDLAAKGREFALRQHAQPQIMAEEFARVYERVCGRAPR